MLSKFVDMFDTIGTLMGARTQASYIDDSGELPRANQALSADAIATTAGAIMGTSTVTTFAESAAGVSEGGRTGLTAVVAAVMFVVALLFVPIFEAVPAFVTMFFIPLEFSIAAGLSVGMMLYPFTKLAAGRDREIPVITWVLAAVFIFRFAFEAVRFG